MALLRVVRWERFRISLFAALVAVVLATGLARGAGRPLPPPCTAPPSPDPILVQLNGDDPLDRLGHAVAFGDVNGDSRLDLILGAGGGQGYVEVISGADVINCFVDAPCINPPSCCYTSSAGI